jgi:hypothetical protein
MRSAVNRVNGGATGGYVGAPVMTVHIYYDSPSDSNAIFNRSIQTQRVIKFLKKLLIRDPFGFNTAGSTNPLHPGNRIILVGDSNLLNTNFAELNGHLVMLRDAFGSVIDPAMASTDKHDDLTRAMDTHYGALPLMDSRMLSVTHAAPFMTRESWWSQSSMYRLPGLSSTDLDFGVSATFLPWWVGGETGYSTNFGGGGDRHDVILLVGLGWAQDDPVRQYLVPNAVELDSATETALSPMTGRNRSDLIERGGIDIRHYCNPLFKDLVQGQYGASYEPEFTDVCSAHDDATKKMVYRSDHKPVGIRLRIRAP